MFESINSLKSFIARFEENLNILVSIFGKTIERRFPPQWERENGTIYKFLVTAYVLQGLTLGTLGTNIFLIFLFCERTRAKYVFIKLYSIYRNTLYWDACTKTQVLGNRCPIKHDFWGNLKLIHQFDTDSTSIGIII